MKRIVVLLGLVCMVAAACDRMGKSGNNDKKVDGIPASEVIVADTLPVKVTITDGHCRTAIRKFSEHDVLVQFESGKYDLLHAVISGVSETANLRFNSITMPDGASAGPFGRDIDCELVQRGVYGLSVGSSMMHGEAWGGEFVLDIWLGTRVPYVLGRNYFVRNDYTSDYLLSNVITTEAQFNTIFGKAAVLGNMPTPIDFSKQYVIAIVEPMTDRAVHYNVEGLVNIGGKINMAYRREEGEPRGYFVRPMLMLVVDGTYPGNIEIVEI